MAGTNLIADIPTCLLFDICSGWLGCTTRNIEQPIFTKPLILLDTALCNRRARQALLALYRTHDWSRTSAISCDSKEKLRWLVARRVKLSDLILTHFPNCSAIVKSFFQTDGQSLQVLKLVEFSEPNQLFAGVHCPQVTKLSLLEKLPVEGIENILSAFPNVVDIELNYPMNLALRQVVSGWKLETLRLTSLNKWEFNSGHREVQLDEVSYSPSAESLRTIVVMTTPHRSFFMSASRLECVLKKCTHLSSITLWVNYFSESENMLKLIAKLCNVRLNILRISVGYVTAAAIEAVANHCCNLKILNIGNHYFAAADYTPIFIKCTKLTHFREHTLQINAAMLTAMATHCAHLEVLSGTRGRCAALLPWHLLRALGKLRVVEIQDCPENFALPTGLKGVKISHMPYEYEVLAECSF